MKLKIEPVSAVGGAEVSGIDLTEPLAPEARERIYQAFLDHLMLSFRGPILSPRAFCDFARNFGELQPHVAKRYQHPEVPEIVLMTNRDKLGRFDEAGAKRGVGWHSDTPYDQAPAKATLLHALRLPDRGGNTMFANMVLAYECMPEALKRRVEGKLAYFCYGGRDGVNLAAISPADQQRPPVIHPVIRTHPETGRKSVYVNPYHAHSIIGLTRAESDRLLDEIYEWCSRPEFQWEHAWTPGATIIWENRAAWHSGRLDYPLDQERTFLRTTVRGTPTLGADVLARYAAPENFRAHVAR